MAPWLEHGAAFGDINSNCIIYIYIYIYKYVYIYIYMYI